MLAEVQYEVAARDLHVDRRTILEAMLPVDPEPEKIDVKLLGPGEIEDAQDRNRPKRRLAHTGTPPTMPRATLYRLASIRSRRAPAALDTDARAAGE